MRILVTKKEEKALKELLSLSPLLEVTLTYYELRGYLYGIAITPDVIEPGEWLPIIFGDELPVYQSEEQARALTGTLFTVLNKHIAAFNENSLYMPFDMADIKEKDFEKIFEWTSGFEEALALRPDCWEEDQGLSAEEQDHLMNSLVIVEGIVYPEDAIDMFDHLPKAELLNIGINLSGSEIEKIAQIQFFMLQALELSIETIQKHAYNLEEKRKEEVRSSPFPFRQRSSRVGKNVDCPCGSGKKFHQCCGLPNQQTELVQRTGSKKGKVIKVDFPQHGKKKTSAIRRDRNVDSGVSYQLEISLSFTKPEVWRRIQVPGFLSLAELHQLIQLVMGWQDYHIHQFQAGRKFYGPQLADDYLEVPMLDESRFSLMDLEKELLQGIVYTYDFGDNWEHVVLLEKVIPKNEGTSYPLLLDGARACPPEDIGGAPMYQEFLQHLDGHGDKELLELFDVPSLQGYDPDFFDAEAINQILRSMYDER